MTGKNHKTPFTPHASMDSLVPHKIHLRKFKLISGVYIKHHKIYGIINVKNFFWRKIPILFLLKTISLFVIPEQIKKSCKKNDIIQILIATKLRPVFMKYWECSKTTPQIAIHLAISIYFFLVYIVSPFSTKNKLGV